MSQGAVVVIENRTGSVRALVGSCDFSAAAGQVNHALAMRSPGSALKPFTYLLAFEAGAGPWTVLADVPSAFPTPTGPYEPRNFHGHYTDFTPVVREGYRVGVPELCTYKEALNSDSERYFGSNVGNGVGLPAQAQTWQTQPYSIELTLPPLAILILKPERRV